jgi:DNA-directed RNA polymerase specialized sigma24 family protein
MNNQELLQKLKENDSKAWEEAYNLFYSKAVYFYKNLKTSFEEQQEAKDLWQETMLALYINVRKGEDILDIGAYIYGILNNLYKKNKNFQGNSKKNENFDNNYPLFEHDTIRYKIIYEIIEDIFQEWSLTNSISDCVEIIKMQIFDNKTDREIAQKLDIKENYVRVKRNKKCVPLFIEKFKQHFKFVDLIS